MKYFAAILLLVCTCYKAAAQNDCVDAITVCGSMNYSGLHAAGFGIQEINSANACQSMENNSIWFKLKIKDGGTLGFILTPESTDIFVDYDFWIYGPNVTCGMLGSPIRCSTTNPFTSGGTNNLTGMNDVATDEHEGPNHLGDQFIKQLDVLDNEEYYLIVDRPHGDANFSIQWTGTATFFEMPYFNNPLNISLDMGVCDTDGRTDGHFLYDLTIHKTMLIGTQDDVALTYHIDSGDALTGDNPIPNPQVYTTIADPQVIHMRMTNTITGCYTTETFTVDTVRPEFENPPNIDLNLHACDDDGITDGRHVFNLAQHEVMFLGNRPDVTVRYYETEAAAYAETGHITVTSPYINTSNPQTFYIRLNDAATGCYNVQPFTMEVHPLPVFQNPQNISLDLKICDQDGMADGVTNFDLTAHWVMLTGGDTNLFIRYYRSFDDARTDTGAIMSATWYQNVSPSETIYMRLEDLTTGCFSIGSFDIDVALPPAYNNPQGINLALEECDNGSYEGAAVFNLAKHALLLTGGQPNLSIKYYRQEWHAQWDANPITNPASFTNTQNPQTIYMRLEDALTGCFNIMPFTVSAIPAPVFFNPQNVSVDIIACDDDGLEDGRQIFNLTLHESMLKGSQQNTVLSYHTDAGEAETGAAPIQLPGAYSNISNPQTIYIRMINTVTGCYNVTQFSLTVSPLPQFNNPGGIDINLKGCDHDSDGFAVFDLTAHRAMLTGGTATRNISYYTDLTAAESATSAITNPESYTNTSQGQIIYMRLDDMATRCHIVGSFTLNLIQPPVFSNPQNISLDLAVCDDVSADRQAQFDLTVHQSMLIANQAGATITYHLSDADAHAGTGAIISPTAFTNTQTPQVIHMRIAYAVTGCYSTAAFTIMVNPLPAFNNPQGITLDQEECDADNIDDSSYIFNLNKHVRLLRGSQQNINVTFHTTRTDADGGTAHIANPNAFRNTVNPQTVYMRFTNIATGCHAVQEFTVTVVEVLDAGMPDDLYVCDTYENGQNTFSLMQNDAAMKNGQPATTVSYYRTQADAQNRQNRLPANYTNSQPYIPQTIWARLDNAGGCWGHDIKSFTLNIMRLPVIEYTVSIKDFTVDRNSITINITNPENYMYSLDGITYQEHPVFDNLMSGLHKIFIRSKNECTTIDEELVILNYPKFFSPNQDGYNETWHIPYLSRFPKSKVYIFDRYGKLITGYNGMHPGWDGTYNGHRLPATDYWFALELEDGRIIKSHFSLIR